MKINYKSRPTRTWIYSIYLCLSFLVCGCMLSSLREQVGKGFAPPFGDLVKTGTFLGFGAQEYYRANNRWPADFEEMVNFWEKMDLKTRTKILEQRIGKLSLENMDMNMFEDVKFSPQKNGSLKAEYIRKLPIAGSRTNKGTITIDTPRDAPCGEQTGTKAGSSTKTKRESLNSVKSNSNK